jgi:hypothetical protein
MHGGTENGVGKEVLCDLYVSVAALRVDDVSYGFNDLAYLSIV